MPLEISNRTAYTVKQLPMLAPNGANIMQTVVKAAFTIGPDGTLRACDEHPEVVLADEYWGEEGHSALRRETDVALGKPYTDLLVLGHAWAPRGHAAAHVDVGLSYDGNVLKRLRVSGDRRWYFRGAGWQLSDPEPFEQLPLTYDRAFGGMDEHGSEPRNRVGLGYHSRMLTEQGKPAPNIEHVEQLISSPSDRPTPAGIGVISRDWSPRLEFAGTYDAHWLDEVFPLLPHDFDMRFNHSADMLQWIVPRGGEQVVCTGLHPDGAYSFVLPDPVLHVAFFYKRKPCARGHLHLETVLLDAERGRVELTWKAAADTHGDPFDLEETMISHEACVRESNKDCGC